MAKAKSTAKRAAKAIEKARGRVYYAEPERRYGVNLSSAFAKAKKQVERVEKAGGTVSRKRVPISSGISTTGSAAKSDVAASKKKTLKASGTGFKSTARQVKLERERTATRAAAMAKRAKKK